MLQEYFNNTIEQSFLKSLLSAVQLPNYKIIRDNDLIFKDYFYIYEGDIIKCTKTGYINPQNSVIGVIQVGDQISPSQAEFEMIKHYKFSCMDQNNETKEFIRASYYSTELHKRFGNYLRCLRDLKNINLMGMYNCFSYEIFNDIHSCWNGEKYIIYFNQDNTKKLLAVPVKFNTIYTVAIQSQQPISIFPILKMPNGKKLFKPNEDTIKIINGSQFEFPFKVSVDLSEQDGDWYKYEPYLYLVFQVSAKNQSSFVVLEGDYSKDGIFLVSPQETPESKNDSVDLMYRPKLLSFNSGTSYAYSDTVIQYLLKNVITNDDTVEGNISYAKKLVNFSDDINYWDNNIKYSAYMKYIMDKAIIKNNSGYYKQNLKNVNQECEDVTGFIDKQIEEYLNYGSNTNISANN